MQFAYLHRLPFKNGEELRLREPVLRGEEIALQKARSLLWYLLQNDRLTLLGNVGLPTAERWLIYGEPKRTAFVSVEDTEAAVIVPTKHMAPVWEQPGSVLVRNDFETNQLFLNWLGQSGNWYKKHPAKLRELQENVRLSH